MAGSSSPTRPMIASDLAQHPHGERTGGRHRPRPAGLHHSAAAEPGAAPGSQGDHAAQPHFGHLRRHAPAGHRSRTQPGADLELDPHPEPAGGRPRPRPARHGDGDFQQLQRPVRLQRNRRRRQPHLPRPLQGDSVVPAVRSHRRPAPVHRRRRQRSRSGLLDPSTYNGAPADIILGHINEKVYQVSDSAEELRRSSSIPATPWPCLDGANLYVTDPFNRRVMVFSDGDTFITATGVRKIATARYSGGQHRFHRHHHRGRRGHHTITGTDSSRRRNQARLKVQCAQ